MPDEHWSNEFEHESVTDDNREAFKTAMSKYPTQDEAVVGGFNAMKLTGKPFKMPESLDNLPDDASRTDFTTQAHKLLGIEHAANVEALVDLDLKLGSAEGSQTDENLANAFKQFIVKEGISKGDAQKMLGFYNQAMGAAVTANNDKRESDKLAAAKVCNEALVKHYGNQEKVDEQSELLRKAVKNNMGLSAEEYEEFGDELANSILTKNPVMARGLITVLAPLAAEGSTEGGGGGGGGANEKQLSPYEWKKERWPKSPNEWGNSGDTWETQDIQLRKLAGIK